MVILGALIVIACLIGIVAAWLVPELHVAGRVAATALVAVAAWTVWWGLLFFQVVRLDPILRLLNVDRLDAVTQPLVFLGPPLVAAAAFAAVMSQRRRRARDGNRRGRV